MNIKIKNPIEDQYGNRKENIFLAFNDNGSFFGHSYVFPNLNNHQIDEIPFLIFIDVSVEAHLDEALQSKVKQLLFNKVFSRAKEIRNERSDLNARIYSGFEYNKEKMNFYKKNGFEEGYSIIMEAVIEGKFNYQLPAGMEVMEVDVTSNELLMEYRDIFDEIFTTPLNTDALIEQSKQKYFKNLYVLVGGKKVGGCTIFEKDGYGYIETMFVVPEARGKGISKVIIQYIFDYFSENRLNKTTLEVWGLNERAVQLYKSFGYKEVEKNLMFPGITL